MRFVPKFEEPKPVIEEGSTLKVKTNLNSKKQKLEKVKYVNIDLMY